MCLSMQEIASLTGCRYFAMVLHTYIDDSWDGERERAVVAGCYLGEKRQWSQLAWDWKLRLKGEIKYFRSTEYYSLRGEFEKFRDPVAYPKPKGSDAARQLRQRLFELIKFSGMAGMAVCVPLDLYEQIRGNERHADKILAKDAFIYAIQELFSLCAETVQSEFPTSRVAFVCDDSDTYPAIAQAYREYKELNPRHARVMETIVPLDDKTHPQLQAADVMAHLARERYMEWLTDPHSGPKKLDLESRLNDLRVFQIRHASRDRLMGVLEVERKRRGLA